jgi:hypothetical protein
LCLRHGKGRVRIKETHREYDKVRKKSEKE